jgi:hypothetical protein
MKLRVWLVAACLGPLNGMAADFGTPGGALPGNLDGVMERLKQEPYEFELLISFGTSRGGSAGHLALAVSGAADGDDLVYSANFYADRSRRHASGFYTADLMLRVPKKEYLYGTASTLGDGASFGLDFGEVYKRSVIGVRVYGVPVRERQAVAEYFARINDDYRRRARNTEYHRGEIHYDYLHLNCAKTIGAAFRYGAGYSDLEVTSARLLSRTRLVAAATANIPAETAMRLMQEWNARGYRMDAVVYRKYPGSRYVDPRDEEPVAFKDLPNRFPSVLSRDFRNEEGQYEDPDNLYVMYLLYNIARYNVVVDEATKRLEIGMGKEPMPYDAAARLAAESASSDSDNYGRRVSFLPKGRRIDTEP